MLHPNRRGRTLSWMTALRQPSAGSGATRLDGISRENRVLRELVAIYHHLTGLALQSADLDSVIRLLARRTAAMVAVVSPTLDVMAAAASDPSAPAAGRAGEHIADRRLGRVLSTVTQTRRALRLPATDGAPSLVVAPILVGDEVVAHLLAEEAANAAAGEDLSLLVTEHAATICGVILGRERIVGAAAGRVRDDLVEGLLLGRAGSPEELRRWAQHLGYDDARVHRVLCVVVEVSEARDAAEADARGGRILRSLEHFVAGRAPSAIVAVREQELVVVAREPGAVGAPPGAASLGAAGLAHVRRAFPAAVLTAGLGGPCREPVEIARAYAQARRTIATARRLGRQGQVVAFEELGIHRLLLEVPDLSELRAFADEVLDALAAYERKHRAGYLRTLAVYFRENGSLQRAARELRVHPNTVTYRLNRVEALTGLDLGRYQDRLMAQVALEIMEALGG